jgi:NTP pyrophosphatase (non-canonical NTP hydrolase)
MSSTSKIPSTFDELCNQVGEWAAHNFDVFAPDLGFGEEVGEITHGVLKAKQGIRGFNDPAKLAAHLQDGIADAVIYLAHWCHLNRVHIQAPTKFAEYPQGKFPLGKLFQCAGKLIDADSFTGKSHEELAFASLQELTNFAAHLGWNLMRDCVLPTWEKVRLRDWRRFPKNGLTE